MSFSLARFNHPLTYLIAVSVVLNAILWFVCVIFPKNNPAAVLHYSADLGIDFIGEGSQITVLPIVGSILIAVNLVLGWAVIKADRRVSWVLWGVLPFLELVLLGAFFFIWQANA